MTETTIPARIEEMMTEHKLSLRKLAKTLYVDPGYLSKLHTGAKDNPSPSLLHRLGLMQHVSYTRAQARQESVNG
jgi:transcriptional regulator with XRE-family HTH domain